jgi:hypothetical protein
MPPVAHRGNSGAGLGTTSSWLQTGCLLPRRIIMRPLLICVMVRLKMDPAPMLHPVISATRTMPATGAWRTHHASEEGGHAHHRKCVRLISICPVNMVFEALAARNTD